MSEDDDSLEFFQDEDEFSSVFAGNFRRSSSRCRLQAAKFSQNLVAPLIRRFAISTRSKLHSKTCFKNFPTQRRNKNSRKKCFLSFDSIFFHFLAHFPLGKESYCPHFVRPFVCPSVTASTPQGVNRFGSEMWLKKKLESILDVARRIWSLILYNP